MHNALCLGPQADILRMAVAASHQQGPKGWHQYLPGAENNRKHRGGTFRNAVDWFPIVTESNAFPLCPLLHCQYYWTNVVSHPLHSPPGFDPIMNPSDAATMLYEISCRQPLPLSASLALQLLPHFCTCPSSSTHGTQPWYLLMLNKVIAGQNDHRSAILVNIQSSAILVKDVHEIAQSNESAFESKIRAPHNQDRRFATHVCDAFLCEYERKLDSRERSNLMLKMRDEKNDEEANIINIHHKCIYIYIIRTCIYIYILSMYINV